jgi:hypothetical protein
LHDFKNLAFIGKGAFVNYVTEGGKFASEKFATITDVKIRV